jgi:branched-chain amino acid aminotransferase
VHVTAHALHYGSSVFEGIRAYETQNGPAIFRLRPHVERLLTSARMFRMGDLGYSADQLEEVCVELVARNGHRSCYLRPLAFRNSGPLGLKGTDCPVDVVIFSVEWGRYLGAEAIEEGIDAAVSSWRRPSANQLLPMGKIGGQYVNSQLVTIEANGNGFVEGIVLDERGRVSEGAGENIFLVHQGTIFTPPMADSILGGITRDCVVTLARDLGFPLRSESLSRDMLYVCDEIFMTGTAAEITPVRSVDRLPVGNGKRGPITQRLQEEFFGIVNGKIADRHGWLTHVPQPSVVTTDR